MKKMLTKFAALSGIALLMLSACKKEGALVTSNGGKAGTLTASTTTPNLDKTKLADPTPVVNFSFTAANYGFSASVTNTLQIDPVGDNWAKPTSVTLGNNVSSQGYSVADFNNLLLKLNLPAGVASQVNVRVVHSISADVAPVYSNVVTLTVTPFNLTSWLYITGAFANWENPGPLEDSLISVTGNGVYTGIINFTAGNNQFLILPAKNWNNKYATSQSSTPTTTVTYNASNNINAPAAAGQYIVTFNVNTGAITFAQANSYSIIGDAAQGWGTDVPMKFVNDGNNNWVATLPLVSTGSFKVRQNNDWTFSWGVPKAGSAGAGTAGTLNDTSNDNISVASTGTHTVAFSIPMTAVGTTPSVTATYTLH